MKPSLHTHGVWSRLTALARQHHPAFAAVPYFGSGASELLPLKAGSKLIVKFDRESVLSGQVNPQEIIRLLKRGVEVHACANLHAKVFVFGNTAIVGSANVSASSANSLVEACVEIKNRSFAIRCRRFIESLAGDTVGLEFAKKMAKLYKPPQFVRSRRKKGSKTNRVIPKHSDIWLVSLIEDSWQDIDYENEEAGLSKAKKALTNPRKTDIETFLWQGGRLLDQIKVGERILMSTQISKRKTLVSPPGKILDIRRYKVGERKRGVVYLEVPRNMRRRDLKTFLKSLGASAKALGHPRRTKRLRNAELVYTLGKVFA